MKQPKNKKILIAAGGTGGHLFPAQALADALLKKEERMEVLFAGKGLTGNRYFHRDKFLFRDISSATPFSGNLAAIIRSLWGIVQGVRQAMLVLREFQPDLIVGFGSFHTFPVLVAALLKKIPIALFEPNSIPGKVNRLFSRFAVLSAVQFTEATHHMRGPTVEVSIPLWQKGEHNNMKAEEARHYFGLKPDIATLLVFGGSQGASSINHIVCGALEAMQGRKKLQIIHVTGRSEDTVEVENFYRKLGILACVKDFETKMSCAWRAADFAICRAGAATLGELIAFEVPAILIPFPRAADDHQTRNALFLEKYVHGGIHMPEALLNVHKLSSALELMLSSEDSGIYAKRQAIRAFKAQKEKGDLCSVIHKLLQEPVFG
ncbi:MAG TPA: undecaprenyldiphospho-muramoylpentapeptide beta-N-acetylglucosaminyltransferase [Rhabdochlamydiaceae bacterium]|nr:undecaprenyldiphospho-muramoylpentapeptide beta-N-acetylglucosaminyltransferase [Rhabdochlamydiaceae bacterium]